MLYACLLLQKNKINRLVANDNNIASLAADNHLNKIFGNNFSSAS